MKRNKQQYTFIDLFAGLGGFHIALQELGCKCVFASELKDDLRKLYEEYLQPIITQYFIDNKSEIWLLFLIAHSKR